MLLHTGTRVWRRGSLPKPSPHFTRHASSIRSIPMLPVGSPKWHGGSKRQAPYRSSTQPSDPPPAGYQQPAAWLAAVRVTAPVLRRGEDNMENYIEQYQAKQGGVTLHTWTDVQGWKKEN